MGPSPFLAVQFGRRICHVEMRLNTRPRIRLRRVRICRPTTNRLGPTTSPPHCSCLQATGRIQDRVTVPTGGDIKSEKVLYFKKSLRQVQKKDVRLFKCWGPGTPPSSTFESVPQPLHQPLEPPLDPPRDQSLDPAQVPRSTQVPVRGTAVWKRAQCSQ